MSFSTLSGWTGRGTPLIPSAVIARGTFSYTVAEHLLDRSDEQLFQLRGVTSGKESVILVTGPFEMLPWAPEAIYLGHEDASQTLLWPIHLTPPFAPELVERALYQQFSQLTAPLGVVPQWGLIIPLGEALPLQRSHIERFLQSGATP